MSVDVGFSSRWTLLAVVLASQTLGCSLFPDVSGFVGTRDTGDASLHTAMNVPCDYGEPRYVKPLAPVSSAGFGSTIVTDGTTLVVVAPQERTGAPVISDPHDPAVACPARPESFVTPSGMIHVFSRSGIDWVEEPFAVDGAELVTGATTGPPDGPPILSQHNFTLMSVALSGDRLAIGLAGDNAPGALRGSVRLFERTSSGWHASAPPLVEPDTETFSIFGYSVALSGTTLVVGAPGALPPAKGASYVYDLAQDPPLLLERLRPEPLDDKAVFGADVAVSDDWVIVGAPGEHGMGLYGNNVGVGAAYVYHRPDLEQRQLLTPMLSNSPQAFGTRLVLHKNLLLVAAPATSGCQGESSFTASGVVNPYELASGKWQELPCIGVQDEHAGLFGWSLALSEERLLVGAPFSWSGDPFNGMATKERSALEVTGAAAGRAYVFDRHGNAFVESCFLEAPNPDPCDNFGQSVAMGGDVLAVGAFGEDGQTGSAGAPDTQNALLDSGALYLYPARAPVPDR